MLNNISLVGNLATDPDLRATTDGSSICKLTIANENYNHRVREKTIYFIDVVAWGKTAEFISKWFKKEDPIAITGKLVAYTLAEKDGARKVVEVQAMSADFVPVESRDVSDTAKASDTFPF